MTLGKESGLVFTLAFEKAAANSDSKSLLKPPPPSRGLHFPYASCSLLISCDFHTGSCVEEQQGEGLDVDGWLTLSEDRWEGREREGYWRLTNLRTPQRQVCLQPVIISCLWTISASSFSLFQLLRFYSLI